MLFLCVRRDDTQKNRLQQELDDILLDIEKYLNTGFLEVRLRDDERIWTVPVAPDFRNSSSATDCPPGWYWLDKVGCGNAYICLFC
jgi:hypothetical protein